MKNYYYNFSSYYLKMKLLKEIKKFNNESNGI